MIPDVYDEITDFVAKRNPKSIAVNTSPHLSVADGISYSEYVKLEKFLGPKYSQRIVSAEYVISDFLVRRTLREMTAQANTLEVRRQIVNQALSLISPGVTTIEGLSWWAKEEAYKRGLSGYSTEINGYPRIYYSANSEHTAPLDSRFWIRHSDYVLQRGDFFAFNVPIVRYMGFQTDTKTHAYILRKEETHVPKSIQYAFDQVIKATAILRPHVKVSMTTEESLNAMVTAMEEAGYIYTAFTDDGIEDYKLIQRTLAATNKSGFYIDFHSIGNNGSGLNSPGPSMAAFRQDMAHLKIQENHLFAFEYAVHTNLPERPGFPISINICNPQIVSSRNVEWIQPPNEKIVLIH